MLRAVATVRTPLWRMLLPWAISAAALGYVFGFATDWDALVRATKGANLPLYIGFTVADKMIFFLWWGILQAAVIRRFVTPVATRELISVRGGAELLRTVNNPVADAGFLYGVLQLTRGRVAAVVAVATIPLATHFFVLLLQATLSLAFLRGGPAANRDILVAVSISWTVLACALVAVRTGLWERKIASTRFGAWTKNLSFRTLLPFLGWFTLLAGFDVMIQGLPSSGGRWRAASPCSISPSRCPPSETTERARSPGRSASPSSPIGTRSSPMRSRRIRCS